MLKASGHQVVIMADLSNMASVWFIHSLTTKIGRGPSDCVMKYRRNVKKVKMSARFFSFNVVCFLQNYRAFFNPTSARFSMTILSYLWHNALFKH